MSIAMAASSTIFNRRCKPRQEGANRTIPSDGQKLTKKLLTISLTIFLVTEVVKLNKNSPVKTVV